MRISDWSSDVCSSDLVEVIEVLVSEGDTIKAEQSLITVESDKASMEIPASAGGVVKTVKVQVGDKGAEGKDRNSVVLGKSVSVRVDLDGRSIIKKIKVLIHSDNKISSEFQSVYRL